MAVSKARNATDSRSGQLQHSFSSVVSRSQCERFKRRLEDFHRKLSTFPGQGKSVVAVKDRLQSFSDTLETRMRVEGAQLILAAEAGLSAADSSLILNNASSRFHDCFTDATSCIVVVESEIGRCQEQTGFARQDVVELKRQVEEARREASRLREECQAIAATISTIDSEIEHLAEKEKRHRDQAKRNEDAAIAWGVGGLVLAPFTFGLSVVAAAPAAIVNVVNMEEHREKARDCESRKGDCQRSLSEKESQKSRWTSRIDDLSRECNQKETHIGTAIQKSSENCFCLRCKCICVETLTAMTALLEELKTFLHNLSSSFDAARLTVGVRNVVYIVCSRLAATTRQPVLS